MNHAHILRILFSEPHYVLGFIDLQLLIDKNISMQQMDTVMQGDSFNIITGRVSNLL